MPARGSVPGDVYEIRYVNSSGVVTDRVIRVETVNLMNETAYVEAFCYLRGGERTFRADRIRELISHRTGEVIDDPLAHFERYYDPPDELVVAHAAVWSRVRPGLNVLVWIARADGDLDAETMDLLLDYIEARRLIGGARASGLDWDRDVALRKIVEARPTFDQAAGALARLPPAGKVFHQLRDFAARLSATSAGREKRGARLFGK